MHTFKYYVAVIRDDRNVDPTKGLTRYFGVIPVSDIAVEMDSPFDMISVRDGLTELFNKYAEEKRPLPESKGFYFVRSDASKWLRLQGMDPIDNFLDIKEVYVTVKGDL